MNSKTMSSCSFLIIVPKMYLKVFEKYLEYFCKVFAFAGNQKYLHLHLKNHRVFAFAFTLRQSLFVTLYLPTIPTQALDTLYIWKGEQV